MTHALGSVFDLAARQYWAIARWQLTRLGLSKPEIDVLARGYPKLTRGVYLLGELSPLSWYVAAALALGPKAVVSHRSALVLLGLLSHAPGKIHVSVPHDGSRAPRDWIRVHRRRWMDWGTVDGIPVMSPRQSLIDADLAPFEYYRALEQADKREMVLDLPVDRIVRLKQKVRGYTRSDAEARFLLLCADAGFPLPLVNHHLNGVETDFHWPRERLVVEVDGWQFHKDRAQFEEDRRRGLVHNAGGYDVVRVSARQVERAPQLVERSLLRYLAI